MTHAQDAFDVAPYINISSAEKRSGKSRIQEVAEHVIRNPLRVDNASPAYVYRSMAGATLLLDEADKIFAGKDEYSAALTGAINGGWRRGSGAGRVDKSDGKLTPVKFDAFGPKMLAGIGRKVPDTILDRSIPLHMERKAPGERVARLRQRKLPGELRPIADRLTEWASASVAELSEAEPHLPEELHDRAQDIWEPLLAVADMAGAGWPERAREAAVALHGSFFEDDSLGVRLLKDIRAVFADRGEDRISSADLVSALNAIEESPWGGWPMDPRKLARDLKMFKTPDGDKIKPKVVRLQDGGTPRGYLTEQFEDAWRRYLDAPPGEAQQAQQAQQPANALPAALQPVADVADVADTQGSPSLEEVTAQVRGEFGPEHVEELPENPVEYARQLYEAGNHDLFDVARTLNAHGYRHPDGRLWRAADVALVLGLEL